MKNFLIIYNIIFFSFGNVLLSNIHYLHHHHHHHDYHHAEEDSNSKECDECIVYDNNKNFNLLDNEIRFSSRIFNIFIFQNFEVYDLELLKKYSSRAPPTYK
tara:strand:- start:243 stop:548 length:306 start_codon:yes stop_codon:yes gene_type:complete